MEIKGRDAMQMRYVQGRPSKVVEGLDENLALLDLMPLALSPPHHIACGVNEDKPAHYSH